MAKNITFQSGIKTYQINGDPNCEIAIQTTDLGIFSRANEVIDRLGQLENDLSIKYENLDSADVGMKIKAFAEFEKIVRSEIDFLFNAPIADIVFGKASCISTVNGMPMYVLFIDAVLEEIEKDVKKEQEKSESQIAKYRKQAETLKRTLK